MFLQNILQQRLKSLNEEEQRYLNSAGAPGGRSVMGGTGRSIMGGTDGFGGSNKVIGSIRNRQVNFSPEHTFFNSQNHMFPKAQQVRTVVKNEIDKDLLGTKAPGWNQSVAYPAKEGGNLPTVGDFNEAHHSHQKFLIRHGFQDETITRSDPQTIYAGTDTRDVYYHGWDVSHELTPPRDKERQYQMERSLLMDKTSRVANKVIQRQGGAVTKYGITSDKYITPEQISGQINLQIRNEKDAEQDLWKELLIKARYDLPDATDQKLHAVVFKQIQSMKHGKQEEDDPELTLRPNCRTSAASKPPAPVKKKARHFKGIPMNQSNQASKHSGKSNSEFPQVNIANGESSN